ncbi:MAG: glycosyltransferase family 2 protein [Treponema sp.]|nr:glycosyltransferase family 2 protein [Treponema sp.]MCL2250698.1 glycosyltransferase family 2 protein [Treponema sp.]
MDQLSKISVVLPSFNPSKEIISVIQRVINQGFSDVIVINDGSREDTSSIFDEVSKINGCTVLHHNENMGKGAALKTGMTYFLENRPLNIGIITIDDDGQHLPEDIKLCAQEMAESGFMVLGARDFNKPSVPLKSRIGNKLSAKLFSASVGLDIADCQTGLRAIPGKYLKTFLNVSGNRFEYETNMLIEAKKERFSLKEVPISTVYIDGNKSTHFKPVRDSIKIIFQFIKYAQSSLISFAIDLLCFYIFLNLLRSHSFFGSWNVILISTIASRILSSLFNFFFNKNFVFKYSGKSIFKTALKYYILCGISMLLSGNITAVLSYVFNINAAFLVTLIKIAVDMGLFVMNYYIQRKWVFK